MNNDIKPTKEDIEGVKKDVESLASRLSNIKDNSGDIMAEQFDKLISVMSSLLKRKV